MGQKFSSCVSFLENNKTFTCTSILKSDILSDMLYLDFNFMKIIVFQLVDCRVVKKTEGGLDVKVLPSEKDAFLPVKQLSDHLDLCPALLDMYRDGDIIKDAMYFSHGTNIVSFNSFILTSSLKNSHLDFGYF